LKNLTAVPQSPEAVNVEISEGIRVTHRVYDDLNRLIFKISPKGIVTEYGIDGENNRILEKQYDNPLNTLPEPLTIASVRAALTPNPAKDTSLRQLFDGANRCIAR